MFTLNLTRKHTLNESMLKAWGAWNKTLLRYIYGNDTNVVANLNEEPSEGLEFKITGEYEDVKAYAQAIKLEADYLRSYIDDGKDAEITKSIKADLDQASEAFVQKTGLPWPFKD
jgi:hypothetical protein